MKIAHGVRACIDKPKKTFSIELVYFIANLIQLAILIAILVAVIADMS